MKLKIGCGTRFFITNFKLKQARVKNRGNIQALYQQNKGIYHRIRYQLPQFFLQGLICRRWARIISYLLNELHSRHILK